LSFDMRRCGSPHRSWAHCREVHLPAVPGPDCTENVEPSKISTERATGLPVWKFEMAS
jgi:hypothetical protein